MSAIGLISANEIIDYSGEVTVSNRVSTSLIGIQSFTGGSSL